MIACYFCETTVETVDIAIDLGWIPSFMVEGDKYETPEPVCPTCQAKHLVIVDGIETCLRNNASAQ